MQEVPSMWVAQGVSGDGQVVLGRTGDSDTQARRWSQTGGTQGFGPLSGTPLGLGWAASAYASNTDGSLITGYARVTISNVPIPQVISTPFVWDAVNGARTIPLANGSLPAALATDMNPAGTVIVGVDITQPVARLFRWSQPTGYQFFGVTSDINEVSAIPRTSADGNAVVAGLNYWSPSTGVITIQQLLTQSGCTFTGWTITGAAGISDDGLTIAGNGVSPTGQTQAWIATVPSPGAGVAGVAVLACRTLRRRRCGG